jgi:uncharacterized repeat protein (TIGR01451 family)
VIDATTGAFLANVSGEGQTALDAEPSWQRVKSSNPGLTDTATRYPPAKVSFTMSVLNGGPDASVGVSLTSRVPEGTSLSRVTTSQGRCTGGANGAPVTCELGPLDVRASATVVMEVDVRPGWRDPIVHTATITAPDDWNPVDNTATARA